MAVNDTPLVGLQDETRSFRLWLKSEIYDNQGPGIYVPNKNDGVWEWETGLWRVVDVDRTTGLSVLAKYVPPKDSGTVDETDILLGAGPGYQSESFRAMIDTSVMPHTLALESRLHVYGTTLSYVKVFLGSDISATGTVISAMYDQGGTLLGENIPLELVRQANNAQSQVAGVDNYAVKAPMVGYTHFSLPDNEVVTMVAYDDAGVARSVAKMLVVNTAFIRTTDASKKYVQSVHLESPFMAEGNDRLLKFPINLATAALDARGVVTYSNGERLRMPIDGTKFQLHGLSNYVASIVGQKIPLVLTYNLSPEEYVYGASTGVAKHVSEPYAATTELMDGAYSPKLFVTPVWIDAVSGYRLEWFLYNLDREVLVNVTPLVQVQSSSRAFNPTEYGTMQNLVVAVDMNRVDSRFKAWRHVQTVGVALLARGDLQETNWTVSYSPGQETPYGLTTSAVATFINQNLTRINLACGQTTQEAWLAKVFYTTEPLFNAGLEIRAPEPNYFVLVAGNTRVEYPISAWNSVIEISDTLREGSVVYLEFKRRTTTTDLQLGISGMIVHPPLTV